jgi:hypothetical protein
MMETPELVPALQAPIADAKEIQSLLVAAGVEAVLGRDDHCTTGCAPKVLVLVPPADLPRVHEVLQLRWASLLEGTEHHQGYTGLGVEAVGDEEPPCPACGARAPLVEGACAECGLALA